MFKGSLRLLTTIIVVSLLAGIPLTASHAQSSAIDCKGAKKGDTISVLYQWAGEEEAHFNAIIKPLGDACGIVFKPESTRDQALLDTRVQAGTPPDIAFWTLASMVPYQHKLKPMHSLGADKSASPDFFVQNGTTNRTRLALPL